MDSLPSILSARLRKHVTSAIKALPSPNEEWRLYFHGPPMEILSAIYDQFSADGGLIVEVEEGKQILVPILIVREGIAGTNPRVGKSGTCSLEHLMDCRNGQGTCPKFLAFLTPEIKVNQSLSSAGTDYGLSSAGHSSISDWWKDDFIQGVVDDAFRRLSIITAEQRDQAQQLIRLAVESADTADRFSIQRRGPWNVLSRICSIPISSNIGEMVALCCGVPRTNSGELEAREQIRILTSLADHIQAHGFGAGLEKLKPTSEPEVAEALDAFKKHLLGMCDVPSAFREASAYYYVPRNDGTLSVNPPPWWRILTLEKWTSLLEEEKIPEGSLVITVETFAKPPSGFTVSRDHVKFAIKPPDDVRPGLVASVVRQGGGAQNNRTWSASLEAEVAIDDDSAPLHRTPLRYTFSAEGFKARTLKVIVLEEWEPGVVVLCRLASKISPPKFTSGDANLECALTVSGLGRHYIDVYCRSGVKLADTARLRGSDNLDPTLRETKVFKLDENSFGFEAQIEEGTEYVLTAEFPNGEQKDLTIAFTCDEAEPEGCESEFARLVLSHRESKTKAVGTVTLDKNLRRTDLESWMLQKDAVSRSFRPCVISGDYEEVWRRPKWDDDGHPIFSQGRFLHDPRPPTTLITPPSSFVQDREWLAAKIRGDEDNSLVEECRLGELLSTDEEFSGRLESYLSAYQNWISSDPSVALWCDVIAYCALESDLSTLKQVPDAIILSPLHPVRLAWQAMAQKALFLALRGPRTCPAASILDPSGIPDVLHLPLFTAEGSTNSLPFISVNCDSDYWAVLWNGQRLDTLPTIAERPPFTADFGLRIGGIASGFSSAQVVRALDDVAEMLSAKPTLRLMVSSAAGQTNSCNEGIKAWSRRSFGASDDDGGLKLEVGRRILQVTDLRDLPALPADADVSNLTEDTTGAVQWFSAKHGDRPADLGIIAQLETSNPRSTNIELGSSLAWGSLFRHRIRRQLHAGGGSFLSETRSSLPSESSGDGLADLLTTAIGRIESLHGDKLGFEFAPSVSAIQQLLNKCDFVAVSSSAVDPACFLGGWIDEGYLWDYELPSYSRRTGDTTGYYLLSRVKDRDKKALEQTISRLSIERQMSSQELAGIITEVSRRGIPTVRGLSSGHHGAQGDLGLLVACRLLQDGFREGSEAGGMLPVLTQDADSQTICLIVPVDPFRGYLDDLQRSLESKPTQRPDLLVVGITLTNSACRIRLTPIEVKFRGEKMNPPEAQEALSQAAALSKFLTRLRQEESGPETLLWRLAFHHLLASMISFGFRVYSQQRLAANASEAWATIHSKVISAILSNLATLTIDDQGRLIVIDGSASSKPVDIDLDGFKESIFLSTADATNILRETAPSIVGSIKNVVGTWGMLPAENSPAPSTTITPESPSQPAASGIAPPSETSISPAIPAAPVSTDEGPSEDLGSGINFTVGTTVDAFTIEERSFNPSDTRLSQLNIGVVGDLGKGKTQFLKAVILNLTRRKEQNRGVSPRVLIFDYKRDYSTVDFVEAVKVRVVKPQNIPLNIFDISDAPDSLTPWLDRFNFFADLLSKIYTGIGPVQRRNLKTAVKAAYESCSDGKFPTIYDVHAHYVEILDGKADAPLAILEEMVDREMFVRDSSKAIPFSSFLDGVVVIDLASLGQDDKTKNVLVAAMLNMFYEHMLRIPKRPFIGTNPQLRVVDSFLLVDEADNIMKYEFDVLRKLLLQGREFGVGVILASQYLSHFRAGQTDYREPLLTWFIHGVPNVVPAELSSLGITSHAAELAARVVSLANHQCLYKSFTGTAEIIRGVPFFEIISKMKDNTEAET